LKLMPFLRENLYLTPTLLFNSMNHINSIGEIVDSWVKKPDFPIRLHK
jgi:hypothetical protein